MPSSPSKSPLMKLLAFLLLGIPALLVALPPLVGLPWSFGIQLGFQDFCHQMPERSFDMWGIEFAVCHRCFGIYLGIPFAVWFSFRTLSWQWLVLCAIPMLLDWGLHQLGWWQNTTFTQFCTGFLFGFGFSAFAAPDILEYLKEKITPFIYPSNAK
jgi:uncharacterized membrane protein